MTIRCAMIYFVLFFDVLLHVYLYTTLCGKSAKCSEKSKETPKKDNELSLNVEKHPENFFNDR